MNLNKLFVKNEAPAFTLLPKANLPTRWQEHPPFPTVSSRSVGLCSGHRVTAALNTTPPPGHLGLQQLAFASPKGLTVGGQDQHGAEDAHVVPHQLHLVPELHLARVMPVAQVAVNEQDHQGQEDGQDLRRQADVAAREEGQSQHAEQHLQQHQGDLSSHDVVQVRLPVLFAVLEGVHLEAGQGG